MSNRNKPETQTKSKINERLPKIFGLIKTEHSHQNLISTENLVCLTLNIL